MASARIDDPWYLQAFDRLWLDVYAHRDDAEARQDALHLQRLLALKAGDRLLDVACGAGRHCRAFAALGLRVTGVDLSAALLQVAREKSADLPGAPQYMRLDARRLPFSRQFEGAVSLFTSLGYFDDREDDLAILRGIQRALVRGGRFVVDFLNAPQVRAHLRPEESLVQDTMHLTLRRRIEESPDTGASVYKHVDVRDRRSNRRIKSFEERVRLYSPDEMDDLLADAGLVVEGPRLGHVDGRSYGEAAPRLVRVARRP